MSAAGSTLWPFFVAIILTVLILLIGVSAALIVGRRRLVAAHQRYVQGLLRAQDAERTAVAGEVHDGLLHRVRLLQHEIAELPVPAPEELLRARLRFLDQELSDLAAAARGLAHRIYPSQVQSSGLRVALTSLVEELERTTSLRITLTCPEEGLPRGDLAHTIFRVVQEALRNVIRHAGTAQAAVHVTTGQDTVRVEVRDHGVGIAAAGTEPEGGIGILSMRERAKGAGGTCEVGAAPGGGTLVRASFPYPGAARG